MFGDLVKTTLTRVGPFSEKRDSSLLSIILTVTRVTLSLVLTPSFVYICALFIFRVFSFDIVLCYKLVSDVVLNLLHFGTSFYRFA